MATHHKPAPRLCGILADLLSQAEQNSGKPVSIRLSNNLKVDLMIKDHHALLQISRSDIFPSPTEWLTILRHWPYPVQAKAKEIIHQGRHYLMAKLPLIIQTKMLLLFTLLELD